MTKGQRILIVVGSLLLAWILHTSLCEWVVNESRSQPSLRVLGFLSEEPTQTTTSGSPQPARKYFTGLKVEGQNLNPDPAMGIVFGVVTPLAIVMWVSFLALGWRHQSRVGRGLCPKCGYDIKGDGEEPADRCSECGWTRSKPAS